MISVEQLKVEFGVKPLFSGACFVINDRDRIALVGKNGAGKSTLLKILCGMQKPTEGVVAVPNDTTIGYLPQVMILQDDTTVREEARKAFANVTQLKARVDELNHQLSERTDYESEEYAALVERFTSEHERLLMMGAENCEAELERTLAGLGFTRNDLDRPTSEFSGGWRMRIELAKILLSNPDVLLLDEPTNHLDMPSKDVLKEAIKAFDGTAIIVSHDREFLDGLVTKVYEFGGGKVREHIGGIYDYLRTCAASGVEAFSVKTESAKETEKEETKENANKISYAERKERQKQINKAEKAVKESERKIEQMEKRLKELDAILCKPENASNMEIITEYTSTKRALDEEVERWEEASMALEEMK